jgi:hypothetical protein
MPAVYAQVVSFCRSTERAAESRKIRAENLRMNRIAHRYAREGSLMGCRNWSENNPKGSAEPYGSVSFGSFFDVPRGLALSDPFPLKLYL